MARVDPIEFGNLAATGWRAKVADALADPLSQKTPLKAEQARAVVGLAFFLLSLLYVVKTTRAAAEQIRG
jgi:hypothetical protein